MEIEVDENLLRLEYFLLDLDSYKFDRDIIKLLNDLKTLVDNKLFAPLNETNLDIVSQKMKIVFELKKSIDKLT